MTNTTSDAYVHLTTSIGKLYFFDLIVKNSRDIKKELSKPLENFSAKKLFKFYLPYFAYLEKDLIDTKLKRPKKYLLNQKEVDSLSDNELEELAKIFIENNSYLYKKSETKKRHKDDGTVVLSLDNEVDEKLFKRNNESHIDWFYRLILYQNEKEKKQMEKFTSSFSSAVSKDIFKTIGFGNSLENSLNSIKKASYIEHKVEMPQIDFVEIERKKEERRLAPLKELSLKMDAMIEAERQTVSFINQTNLTQMEIATELKSSSDANNKTSKLNIFLTIIVIGLTIFSIWFNKDSKILIDTNKNIELSIQQTNKNINNLTSALIAQNKIQNKKIDLLQKEIKTLKMIKKGKHAK